MDLRIRGRRAVVTGASMGIGRAIAAGLAEEGVDIVTVARSKDLLEEAATELRAKYGVKVVPLAMDLSSLEGAQQAARAAIEALGGIDILVNNAGAIPAATLTSISDEEMMRAWDLKLFGYVRMARELVPPMQERGWGRVVNIIGLAATNPSANYIWGGTANAALMNFTMCLALEGAPKGVIVNAILPGAVNTQRILTLQESWARAAGTDLATMRARQTENIPVRRVGEPEEIADVATYLCSERCTYLVGAAIPVGGGTGAVI